MLVERLGFGNILKVDEESGTAGGDGKDERHREGLVDEVGDEAGDIGGSTGMIVEAENEDVMVSRWRRGDVSKLRLAGDGERGGGRSRGAGGQAESRRGTLWTEGG